MPDPMQKWIGAASFIEGWLGQDEAEQDRQLDYLESLSTVATRAEGIRGAQADTRRAEALFPGQVQQQKLTTTQMGIQTRGMQRSEEMTASLDDLIQKEYGLPSYEIFKSFVDAGATEVLNRFNQATLAGRTPEQKAELEGVKTGIELRTEKAVAAGQAPEAEAALREQTAFLGEEKTDYERTVLDLKKTAKMPALLVDTEKALMELEPLGKKIDMFSTYAMAKARMGALSRTPLGQEQLARDMFARKGLDYDSYRIREVLTEAKEIIPKQSLMENIFSAERARLDLIAAEGDIEMGEAIMLMQMQKNPDMAKALGPLLSSKPQDMKDLVEPLNKYINANKTLLWEQHHLSYDRLGERELQFGEADLNEVIGGMLQDFPGFNDEHSADIRNFLVNMINGLDPMHWDSAMQRHRAGLVQRWSQEDWFAAKQVLDTVQWRMGQEENPDLVRPRAPYLGFPKKTITPLGAIQRTERQQRIESLAPALELDIESLLGEDPLQLDSVERELERLLQ